MPRRQRLHPSIFHLPVDRMREGYYSDKYFVRAREILVKDRHRPCVTMQVFGKAHAFLGGIDEEIAILKLCSQTWEELQVWALYDGDEIAPWHTAGVGLGSVGVGTSLQVTRALGERSYGVRLGTAETRVEPSGIPLMRTFRPRGGNARRVRNVREGLDREGFQHVKIVVSGGF